jgi:glycosyltransferase involved in cell wall biosynthesis
MRILIINDNLDAGGKERRLVELLKGLAHNPDINVEVVLLGPEFHFEEVKVLGHKIHILIRKIKKDPSIFLKLFSITKKFKPDYIHTWGIMPTFYAIPVAKILRIKILNSMITNSPSYFSAYSRLMMSYYFNFSEKVIANSFAGLKAYSAPLDKGLVIYNGFDFDRLNKLDASFSLREKYSIYSKYIVGMVATFSIKKDYKTLIEAFKIIMDQRSDVTFIAVGSGPLVEEYKKLINENSQNFLFLGNQKNIEEIVKDFDIGILSTFTEGISNSVMEYMALSKPVIVTDGGGSSELVIDGETGYLIPQRSPEILADKINYLLDRPGLAAKMGDSGYNRLLKHFSIGRMVSDHIALYHNGFNEA